ncbi:MAG: glycine cleavage system protein H [Candidatus Altiarchaeales archaeon]|nr:MAG: glycine cleavage system protein H [Candidatus Altiarchaeales archaeon]RLI96046.1 MAG: glycine cleavage system protein H [Candidatus Altiarchaeales archaeon]RLI96049.1 MAG: glycine cleavage system protein H [Candidatus Altiarchaeales archaeon]
MKLDNFEFPDDLMYMRGHIWVKIVGDEAKLGITSLGSSLAKEIVHVDLPENDEEFESLEPMASFETIKSVTEISAPFDCKVMGVNEKLLDDPSLINTDPYGDGWIIKLRILRRDNNNLMDVKEAVKYYEKILDKEKERYKGIYE